MLYPCRVLGVNVAVNSCASEIGLSSSAIVHVRGDVLLTTHSTVFDRVGLSLLWAHGSAWELPSFFPDDFAALFQ